MHLSAAAIFLLLAAIRLETRKAADWHEKAEDWPAIANLPTTTPLSRWAIPTSCPAAI
jgi:hypothetical protein